MIMKTQASDDMTKAEKYMAGGGQYGKFGKYKKQKSTTSEVIEVTKELGKTLEKSAKETVSGIKKVGKSLFEK